MANDLPPMRPATARRHTHRDFEGELRALHEALLAMAGRVEQMIGLSARALFDRDGTVIERVRGIDRLVNDAEKDIDGMCLRILARRQPMGSDLRLLTRVLKMVTDIERAGDLAVNLAKQAHGLAQLGRHDMGVHPGIERMAAVVRSMLSDALDAFVERNTELAHSVIARDEEVDQLELQVGRDMVERMATQADAVRVGLHVLESARLLERMGDHATNLAEQVVFLVHAEDIRHPV